MKHLNLLLIIALSMGYASASISAEKAKKAEKAEIGFEESKKKLLMRADKKMAPFIKYKACIENATNEEQLKSCKLTTKLKKKSRKKDAEEKKPSKKDNK